MQIFHKISATQAAFAALILLCAPVSAMADILESQPLNFGRWIITDNNATRTITVQTNGAYSNSPQLIMLDPPQPGIYQVVDLPPFANVLSVDVVMDTRMQNGGSEDFTMDDFQVLMPPVDGAGMTTLTLGARANTSGTGDGYDDATYTGTLEITINL